MKPVQIIIAAVVFVNIWIILLFRTDSPARSSLPVFMTRSIHTGDIVLRRGKGLISDKFRRMSLQDKSYSHSGIIVKEGNEYFAGSFKIAAHLTNETNHNVYVLKNGALIGWIDVADELRPEAINIIQQLKKNGIKTILLSGDKKEKCEQVKQQLGLDEVIAEQTPELKLTYIAGLTAQQPTAMVGDGINDGPALAKATVGISLSDASQIAMQSAQVVLMNHGLKNLPLALGLGKHTYITIKENLFWAFAYNIVAIPVAAAGFLSPTLGALIMGLSDVVLAVNSVRLFVKKVL